MRSQTNFLQGTVKLDWSRNITRALFDEFSGMVLGLKRGYILVSYHENVKILSCINYIELVVHKYFTEQLF